MKGSMATHELTFGCGKSIVGSRPRGIRLQAEGDKLWAKGILEVHDNITRWVWIEEKQNYRCTLETGEIFEQI